MTASAKTTTSNGKLLFIIRNAVLQDLVIFTLLPELKKWYKHIQNIISLFC